MTEPEGGARARPSMRPGTRRRSSWRLVVPAIAAMAGMLFTMSALSADGGDLRPAATDLNELVSDRADRVETMRTAAGDLRDEIDALSDTVDTKTLARTRRQLDDLRPLAGFTEVTGPGLRVSLSDAPRNLDVPGLDPNLLVVHQQDIQAHVNALWTGGATAMTLQGQRLIATTGIKCVGNTVVLDGVPYAPPYVIEAVGDPATLKYGLATSSAVQTYQQYVSRYQLGLAVQVREQVVAPPYAGTVDLQHATAVRP